MSKQIIKENPPQNKESKTLPFALERINYQIMLGGIALILIGFVVMSLDKEPFGFGCNFISGFFGTNSGYSVQACTKIVIWIFLRRSFWPL